MDVAKANQWWQKAMRQHEVKTSHHPTSRKRWVIPTRDKVTMPFDGKHRARDV